MHKKRRILLIEPTVEYARAAIEKLKSTLSQLERRCVADDASLEHVLNEERRDAVVCGNSLPETAALHSFFANLPGMACQIRLEADESIYFPYVSEGCFALLGIPPIEVELNPQLLLDMIHHDDCESFYESMRDSVAQATHWNWEGRILLPPGGEVKWVNLRATRRDSNSRHITWEGFIVNITQSKLAEMEVRKSRERLRELSSHVENIKENERMRIAREIHDDIGVLLTALKMDLSWLTQRLPKGEDKLLEKARSMSSLLDTAGVSANNLVHSLRPGFLDCFGLVAAIEIEANEFSKRTGIPCKIEKSDDNIELDEEQSITLFRVFQETLNNIMKHASAKRVEIEIMRGDNCVDLIVSDDGKGFDTKDRYKPRSFGLRGIQERIGHMGGTVKISSQLGKGASIAVCVPLEKQGAAVEDKPQQNLF
ncbi:MAG: histidine kinase [Gallionella sp.]|nr:histidine kinase [Gallionella sp.]